MVSWCLKMIIKKPTSVQNIPECHNTSDTFLNTAAGVFLENLPVLINTGAR